MISRTEAYRQVAYGLLLELTEDGNDMTGKQLTKRIEELTDLQQEISRKKSRIEFLDF